MNADLGITIRLHPMVGQGNATVIWPNNIHFLTIDTTITKDSHQVQFTQIFPLAQGQHPVTCTNGPVHISRGCIGVDPSNLSLAMFKAVITEPTGTGVPCELAVPAFGQSTVSLNPDNLYLRVQQRYDRVLGDQLWNRLHVLACTQATQDRTLVICNVRQEGVNLSGRPVCRSRADYEELFLWH